MELRPQLAPPSANLVDRHGRRGDSKVEVVGYNKASADLIDRFALHDKTGFGPGAIPH